MSKKLSCFTVAAIVVAFSVQSDVFGQGRGGGGGRGGFGFGGRGGFGGGGPLQLIQRDDVQEELALTSSQKSAIEKLVEEQNEAIRERMRAAFGGGGGRGRRGGGDAGDGQGRRGGGFDREAFARIQEEREKANTEARKEISDILKRDQASRFAELEFRYNLERGALTSALAAVEVDFDEEEIRDEQRKANEELEARISKMRFDAFREALESVVGATKVERFLGDDFTFEANRRSAGRRGRGGRDEDGNSRGRRRRPAAEDSDDDAGDSGRSRRRGRRRSADDA